jgi:hypothetical protein
MITLVNITHTYAHTLVEGWHEVEGWDEVGGRGMG